VDQQGNRPALNLEGFAKAKVAGSNPLFRSNSEAGFTAVFALDRLRVFQRRSPVEAG